MVDFPGLNPACSGPMMLLWDIERQELIEAAGKTCSPLYFHLPWAHETNCNYLDFLLNPPERRAFSLARFNANPSNLLWGRFSGRVEDEGICPCDDHQVERLVHMVFHCKLYDDLRQQFLDQLCIPRRRPEREVLRFLLTGTDQELTKLVAQYLHLLFSRRNILQSSELSGVPEM